MRGGPLGVIAPQLGHSDTPMTERLYTVPVALPALGIVEEPNVAALGRR